MRYLLIVLSLLIVSGCQAQPKESVKDDGTIVYKDASVVVHGVTYPTLGGLMCHTVVVDSPSQAVSVSTSCVSSAKE